MIYLLNNLPFLSDNKIYVNELFKHKNNENINNGFGIIIGIILCYNIILSLISKGVLPVNLSIIMISFSQKKYIYYFS